MQCPRCQSVIPAGDVNLDNLVAKCHRCNEVFSFADQMPRPIQSGNKRPARLPIPNPDSLRIEVLGDRQRIVHRWFTWVVLFLVFFCVVYNGFLLLMYVAAFVNNANGWDWWIYVIGPLPFVAFGIVVAYSTLAGLLNSTTVLLEGNRLTIRIRPLPWRGNRSVDVGSIVRLYCDYTLR